MRLDNYLTVNNFVNSRSKAKALILDNKVLVDGKIINKVSYEIIDNVKIEIKENEILEFVSRGGLKLKKALNEFKIDLHDLVICDIGASTGGFSDCALVNGARKVYAIDVGSNQLDEKLRNDKRVISLENLNFKDFSLSLVDEKIDLYVCDVSFISIKIILKKLKEINENFSIIILYKPQFEVGKNNINKNGVVKKKEYVINSLKDFAYFLNLNKIGILNYSYSPIKGNKGGNIEYLFYLKDNNKGISVDFEKLVDEAYRRLKDD